MPSKHHGFKEQLRSATAFSYATVKRELGEQIAKQFIHNLKEQDEIVQLMRGWYSFTPSPYLLTVALERAYVGLTTAAYLHDAWEQVPNVTILTPEAPRHIRIGERTIADQTVHVRRINDKMYFGYESMHIEEADENIPVATPEKTLIDLHYYDHPFTAEITERLHRQCNPDQIRSSLDNMQDVKGYKKIRETLLEPD